MLESWLLRAKYKTTHIFWKEGAFLFWTMDPDLGLVALVFASLVSRIPSSNLLFLRRKDKAIAAEPELALLVFLVLIVAEDRKNDALSGF